MTDFSLEPSIASLYKAKKDPIVVDVPAMNFLMLDGKGDPSSPLFAQAVEALYSIAYTAKFEKKRDGIIYKVMPLEGIWWADDMAAFHERTRRKEWLWTIMIMQPSCVTQNDIEESKKKAFHKKDNKLIPDARFEQFCEGPAAQILHTGSYSAEGPTIERLHKFIESQGVKLSGKHREIYLSDARKTAEDKLKTIIRQPFTK